MRTQPPTRTVIHRLLDRVGGVVTIEVADIAAQGSFPAFDVYTGTATVCCGPRWHRLAEVCTQLRHLFTPRYPTVRYEALPAHAPPARAGRSVRRLAE